MVLSRSNFLDGRDLSSLCVFHVVRTQNSVIIRLHIKSARTQFTNDSRTLIRVWFFYVDVLAFVWIMRTSVDLT